jgi:iron complex outermembrane receptor protein
MKPTTLLLSFPSLCLLAATAGAQPTQQVTVTGRASETTPGITGFGDTPAWRSPFATSVVSQERLLDTGTRYLGDLTRLDASVNDAYNAEGYWSILSIRGYTVDNRYNYRRDGLPINAETAIGLDNKAAVEILKGTSGMQAGTSAPGGLVNMVVKRPRGTVRSAVLGWREDGSLAASVDVGQRFGEGDAFGLRVNAAAERLDPKTFSLQGHRHLVAAAADWRASTDTTIEFEIEESEQSQPSLPGFSLLGNAVPDAHAIDPRLNLNNQPWTLPVVLQGTTGSVRLTQRIASDWIATAHAMTQHLKSDDRIAFPFGCGAEGNFDRYCSDGSFDMYDFRSENERRRSDALDLSLAGGLQLAGMRHDLQGGVLFTRLKARFQGQAFNFVGVGRIDGSVVLPPDPTLGPGITNRDERSTEFYLRDAAHFSERWTGWLGLRHTRLDRGFEQSFTTPWVGLGYAFLPQHQLYASWGEGVESYVTPGLSTYATPGAPLPAQKSRQLEVGVKGIGPGEMQWSLTAFDIDRPRLQDAPPVFQVDGSQRHRGIEAQLDGRSGPWQWLASATWLHARFEDTQLAPLSGVRPPNVPATSLKLMLGHDVAALPGLGVQAWLLAEGDRTLLPAADSPRIGGWARVDLAAHYAHSVGAATLHWRAGVDNLADRRAWKESPFQFGHVYLYPLQPRTWRLSVQADL